MKFVEKHLTAHHLFHAPHRWFLAFLLSPIHAAELHYQNRYHLRFRHARKLFFFDMILVLFVILLFGTTLFWHFYDPTVRSLVSLKVEQTEERIKTGTKISYTVFYINRSDVSLREPVISLIFPKGFVLSTSTLPSNFQIESSSLSLSPLHPGANGSFQIHGTLFGTPDQDYDTIVKLSYLQEDENTREYVIARLISSPRGTPLLTNWHINDSVLSHGSVPFSLDLQNTGSEMLSNVQFPLPNISGVIFQNVTTTIGVFNGKSWDLEIAPHTTTTMHGNLLTALDSNTKTITIESTPIVSVNGHDFAQKKFTKNLTVVHPSLEASATWKKDTLVAKPTETVPLHILIKNTGNLDLHNVSLSIPPTARMAKKTFVINKIQDIALSRLQSGQSFEIDLQIPLSPSNEGTDSILTLHPEIRADILEVPGAVYSKSFATEGLKISSAIHMNGTLRYYTAEGDQLGLGPLPPQVGQPTRYFAILTLENTTSQIENVNFSATLAPQFAWGNKSSVSLGKDLVYNSANKKVSWSIPSIPPHTTAQISFAVIFTPDENQVGTTPNAIQNITVSASDTFTKLPLLANMPTLSTALKGDLLGQNRGVAVVE